MGADIRVERPKKMNEEALVKQCECVPIDVTVESDSIHFHYAYWGTSHASTCERFIDRFCEKHKVGRIRESY